MARAGKKRGGESKRSWQGVGLLGSRVQNGHPQGDPGETRSREGARGSRTGNAERRQKIWQRDSDKLTGKTTAGRDAPFWKGKKNRETGKMKAAERDTKT